MAEAHILRIDSLPVVDRGNGIQTIPLVTKEIGVEADNDRVNPLPGRRKGSAALSQL